MCKNCVIEIWRNRHETDRFNFPLLSENGTKSKKQSTSLSRLSSFYFSASFPLLFEEIAQLILTLDKKLVDMKWRFELTSAVTQKMSKASYTSDNDTLTTFFELTTRNQPDQFR